jgi:F420-non-reducing hydrogenase iron-sulfur subunit
MTVKRITFLQELMRFMGLEDRLSLVWISSAEAQKYVRAITEFTEKIRLLGPSPLNRKQGLLQRGNSELSRLAVVGESTSPFAGPVRSC